MYSESGNVGEFRRVCMANLNTGPSVVKGHDSMLVIVVSICTGVAVAAA